MSGRPGHLKWADDHFRRGFWRCLSLVRLERGQVEDAVFTGQECILRATFLHTRYEILCIVSWGVSRDKARSRSPSRIFLRLASSASWASDLIWVIILSMFDVSDELVSWNEKFDFKKVTKELELELARNTEILSGVDTVYLYLMRQEWLYEHDQPWNLSENLRLLDRY